MRSCSCRAAASARAAVASLGRSSTGACTTFDGTGLSLVLSGRLSWKGSAGAMTTEGVYRARCPAGFRIESDQAHETARQHADLAVTDMANWIGNRQPDRYCVSTSRLTGSTRRRPPSSSPCSTTGCPTTGQGSGVMVTRRPLVRRSSCSRMRQPISDPPQAPLLPLARRPVCQRQPGIADSRSKTG